MTDKKYTLSKLDTNQIARAAFDEEAYANRVKITDSEFAVALDKKEDSVATSKSTDRHELDVINGKASLDIMSYDELIIVCDKPKISLKVANVEIETHEGYDDHFRLNDCFAETIEIETSSDKIIILGR